jgi:hypothetical protein
LKAIASYPAAERDLIVVADLVLQALVKIELFASKPEYSARLISYLENDAGLDPERKVATIAFVKAAISDGTGF